MKTFFLYNVNNKLLLGKIKKITVKDNKIIINTNLEKANLKMKINIAKKIKKVLEKEKVRQLAIEKELKKDEQFINLLYSNKINICSQKWLLKKCVDEIISKVLKDKKREESEISICVNEVDSQVQEFIYKFAKEFKRINIITNHIGKFKKIEEKLYNEGGILINMTNNRRKSLAKAELILNIDFPKEIINEFTIYEYSIIINLDEKLKIRKKRFNGRIIDEVKIEINNESEILKFIKDNNLENFDERDICQVLEAIPEEINI